MRRNLLLMLFFSVLLLTQGAIPFPQVVQELFFGEGGWNPLLDERLPRLIVILLTGSSLAVSGAVMQALFQNPLASPSVLGISLGGSLGVFIVFILGLHHIYPFS
ncbi:iron ABC transporter permease, partial [Chlamydiales bacterium]|nr:iron ABC transporter permease [Chlamydiales bacterium]